MKNIKDKNRKYVVEEYQKMIEIAINKMESSGEKLTPKQKLYLEGLKDIILLTPYFIVLSFGVLYHIFVRLLFGFMSSMIFIYERLKWD